MLSKIKPIKDFLKLTTDQLWCLLPSLLQALKALFTSRSTGIGRKGRWLAAEDLEAYLYAMSQPGALTGALNYYRNVFRWEAFPSARP